MSRYLAPYNAVFACIAHGTLITTNAHRPVVNESYSLIVNQGAPFTLRGSSSFAFRGAQLFRIVRESALEGGAYRVQAVKYFYEFSTAEGQEILNFQWTPEATRPGEKTFPHLHIGRGLLGGKSAIFPETFHKKHVPTGHVSFAGIIRFAIEELGVPPLRGDWSAVLDRS